MKPLVKTVATTAVVLASLAGCASRSSGGSSTSAAGAGNDTSSASSPSSSSPSSGSASSSSPSAGQTSGSSPSSSGQSGASNPSDPGTVKYVVLQGVTLEKDGITLATEVTWGGCNDQPQIVVKSQDASKVVIELKTVSHAHAGVMCPTFVRNGESTVKLDAPLGSRQVIDGVKNMAISVG